ncbi:hypothetical protein PVAND_006463 [Polypedilum vanderplanki]|uniref:Uncharacterized protein n=1 Tax=Polypedilum vanderplanki TaxID=319348 RepID=A0A9J6C391_POLVA|nr:hypothetical protein PVAND_006463 [Polypedilum vanderplanki]
MERLGINLVNHLENNALIIWSLKNNERICELIKYKDLLKQVLRLSLFIEGEEISSKSIIGILSDKSYSSIALSLAIIEQSFAFCYITKENIENSCLDEFDIKYFFSDSQLHSQTNIKLIKKLKVCDENYYFYKTTSIKQFKNFKDAGNKMNQIVYCVATSGTTGKRKIVRVTYNSILPNIESLQNIFKLNSTDVLLSSAPITFDVYLMDLFLALYSGASLKIIPNELRFDPFVFDSNESKSVTFIQMTPTIFHQYGNEIIKNKIMHAHSRLKYLLLGGEKFPSTNEVLQWQDWNNPQRKRIFNIYGLTEMSCWSLIHEVTIDDLNFGRIPLGESLSDTSVAYYQHSDKDFKENIEELILTSATRVNFVDDKDWDDKLESNAVFAYITNDLIEKINGKLYWYARLDDMVKRFGERVDLAKIETVALEIISPVACILTKKRIALFYQSANNQIEELLVNHLRLKLKNSEFPDDIKRIDFLPICKNGKLSKKNLKELYHDILKEEENGKQAAEDIFLEAINQMFNLKLSPPSRENDDEPDGKRIKSDIDSTFNQIGGTSFDALRVAMKIEDKVEISSNGSLLPKLLDNRHSIKEIFSYLKELNLKPKINNLKLNKQRAVTSLFNIRSIKKFDLQKCIDSSPALVSVNQKDYIAIGSHSGKIIIIEAESNKLITEIVLNDRIECEITQYKNYLIVGCYDGGLYFLDFLNEDQSKIIKYKFDSGGMIKSKALIFNDYLIFGNYNYEQNLRCIKVEDDKLNVKWSKLLGLSGILANPLQIDDISALICTLDGTCERLNIFTGESLWMKKLEFPIFSSPIIIKEHDKILIAEVMRKVSCMDFDGNIYWQVTADGHIFSSFLLKQIESEIKIIFGSHDKKLRCLCYDINYESKISLEWETEIQSQIYTTPKKLTINNNEFVVSCSTNGYVNLIDFNTGSYENSVKLPGEIFSTPLIYKNFIYVGCRDNNFYCLKIEHKN